MKNYFIVINDRIELLYQGRLYAFDLNDGDYDDYWHSFTYNGKSLDINYFPVLDSLTIYKVVNGQIDTSQFETAEFVGDLTNKHIIVNCVVSSSSDDYEKRYNDTKEIIIYDNYSEAIKNANMSTQTAVLISNMTHRSLMKVFTQKINEHERNNLRRGA
jgi:hypothetical protein